MIEQQILKYLKKDIKSSTNEEIYIALLNLVNDLAKEKEQAKGERKLYYISAEFLIGKLLSNNLINLGIFDEVREILAENEKDISDIEGIEPEPSLGNGGLGRLAACFLDSIASLGLNGDGIGLNYHFGLFKQKFENNAQSEYPNPWIEKNSWLNKQDFSCEVEFKDVTVKANLYDIIVTGYQNKSNKLHLFDIESIDEKIVKEGIDFDKTDVEKNLTLFLYPDDSDENGELLRIYQQYFMVSAGAQFVIKEFLESHKDLKELHKYVAIQINDTHPSMVIPELIRLLNKKGLSMDEAIETVSKTCAYTNHTILAEALEKWKLSYIEAVAPCIVPVIKELDKRVKAKFNNKKLDIIGEDKRVYMAHIDMHYGYSINGVASLHTDILKAEELNDFYKIYKEKFNNKTNGITFRRWLLHCNRALADFIKEKIGGKDIYAGNAEALKELLDYKDDKDTLKKLVQIKMDNKIKLKDFIKNAYDIDVDENSIFDIQIKRLHEYKRQQMNLLYIINKYYEIKSGKVPKRPITFIFGAKAAPAYTIAKDIIHAILCLQKLILSDKQVSKYIKIVMVENYNVTMAEKLIPACDVSEQISLASKEASGTGNMKFMLNSAITLGTEDGANVEIHELVGEENIYVFGKSSEEVIEHYKKADYVAKDYYIKNEKIRTLINFIISPEMLELGNAEMLLRFHAELIKKDWFMTLLDLEEYIKIKDKCFADYENREDWSKKMLVNTAMAGYFSSDRTIKEYNKDIWKL
ncbi:MAG: glycogen/starch/alpha-glucan phosphorylase [Clostridia bacterium]